MKPIFLPQFKAISLLLLGLFCFASGLQAKGALVFAAASSRLPLIAAARAYVEQGGEAPRFSFASSSTLAWQIAQGSKADLYLSANSQWMDYLQNKKLIQNFTRKNICSNRLVLTGSVYNDFSRARWPRDIAKQLNRSRLAIGDPAHVPAGIYAKQALQRLGLWNEVSQKLAPANSVSKALIYVMMGEAPLGIVYASDLYGQKGLAELYRFPKNSHRPILYPLALMEGASFEGIKFYRFLASRQGKEFFINHGFTRVD